MTAPTTLKSFERNRTQLTATEDGRTHQSFKDECDVNQILKRWRKSGELNHLNTRQPTYGDFTNPTDYLTACTQVIAAQADFDSLSARIRDRMGNDPAKLLEYLADPANNEEAIELGLIEPPPPIDPPRNPPVADPPPPESPPEPPVPAEPPAPVSGGD